MTDDSSARIVAVAKAICAADGQAADDLCAGTSPYGDDSRLVEDGILNGEPAHFRWRHYERHAVAAIAAMSARR